MSFQTYNFSYNNISSYEMGLMIYDLDSNVNSETVYSSPFKIVEDRISRRYSGLYYGEIQNQPLEFTLIFGCDVNAINQQQSLSRYDLNEIGQWFTGEGGYRFLEIEQTDMSMVRYKCVISELKVIEVAHIPWAFSAKIQCDSPFAYSYPETTIYTTTTSQTVSFYSPHSNIGYYYPSNLSIVIPANVTSISLKNITDNNHECKFTNIINPTGITITIDCQNQIITSSNGSNMYQYFNFNFFRLLRGDNSILITGASTISIITEFPVNVGG